MSDFLELDDIISGCRVYFRRSAVDEITIEGCRVVVRTALGNTYAAEFLIDAEAGDLVRSIVAPKAQESVSA